MRTFFATMTLIAFDHFNIGNETTLDTALMLMVVFAFVVCVTQDILEVIRGR